MADGPRVTTADRRSFARFDGAAVIATGCDTRHPSVTIIASVRQSRAV